MVLAIGLRALIEEEEMLSMGAGQVPGAAVEVGKGLVGLWLVCPA